ncbi:hypothetical protein [Acetobacter orleanensis]|uniref:hypothetical protein n=1 Tax=Acetobacter orleanensis TaxID=104099 RepID=UPI0007776744|nr:hypothetical protein [Acetobacter orleanensis]KXV66245.1 hypothetical protein AD949_03070 [Acetobacter orleanensis]PCD78595.1 hypothetical protein CO710_11550 [Acetobacter orleanensis]
MSECLFPHSFCLTAHSAALREERIEDLLPHSTRAPAGLTAVFASCQFWRRYGTGARLRVFTGHVATNRP